MGFLDPAKSEDEIRRDKIAAYFEPERRFGALFFAALGAASMAGVAGLWLLALPGWALSLATLVPVVLFAVAWTLFNEDSQRASDEDIDNWRDEELDRIIGEVCEEVDTTGDGVLNQGDPIVIVGLTRFDKLRVATSHEGDGAPQSWRFKVKVGKDGITRFTPPCLMVLHFSKDHLIAYQCDYDLIEGRPLNETIDEFFWQDIVALQIEKSSESLAMDKAALVAQMTRHMPEERQEHYAALSSEEPAVLPSGRRTTVRLKTSNGSAMEIVVADERYAPDPGAEDHPLAARNAEAILRLRKLLRERKAKR